MTVSTVASVASGAIQRAIGNNNNRYSASIKSLLATSGAAGGRNDISALSTAVSLQTQVTGLRAASINIAQNVSQVEIAAGGAGQISRALTRLQEIATRASSNDVDGAGRAGLNEEFKAILSQVSTIARSTQFAGRAVLDGSVSAESLGLEGGIGLPDLTSDALFGQTELTVATGESAQRALEALRLAQETLTAASTSIGGIAEALEIGAGAVDSAIQNQEAARSTLSEDDFAAAASQNAQAQVQNEASLSLLAQTNRLPANILQLLSE
ncbi:MAG: hypothetical protein C0436_01820 [Alphaproteobacteria bacterium]|nr:hypothetical protein [Alphaproteobacteria bacterium]